LQVSLRLKLFLALGGVFAALGAFMVFTVLRFRSLGYAIETILEENYRSVLAAEDMKEALERMDSLLSFARTARLDEAQRGLPPHRDRFERALDAERQNITLPGEQEAFDAVQANFVAYLAESAQYLALREAAARERFYFATLLPRFVAIKDACDRILVLNHRAMLVADREARSRADQSMWAAAGFTVVMLLGGVLFTRSLVHSVLEPIRDLTHSVHEIARGDLDQVVAPPAHDELGELAQEFNKMAQSLRAFRKSSLGDLIQVREAAQAAIDSLPDPVVLFDLKRRLHIANQAARDVLDLENLPSEVNAALDHVLAHGSAYAPVGYDRAIRSVREGRELVFLPRAKPMRDESGDLLGATVLLQEVTRLKKLDELKSDVVATVAHELRTPLTALRMNTHLLLEEMAGPLTPKQEELLVASREECDRLDQLAHSILDTARLEAGALRMERRPVAPIEVVGAALDPFREDAAARKVKLALGVPADLPLVLADPDRLQLVFANLVSNALRYTPAGGEIAVRAAREDGVVRFAVEDTGCGIAPEHLPRIFEKYYRRGAVCEPPDGARGAGLGLTIAREVTLAHGGEIGVDSEPGRGARFWFTVPLAREGLA
jgi:signal transduction histidine kinase/HAMP domain-containing protein